MMLRNNASRFILKNIYARSTSSSSKITTANSSAKTAPNSTSTLENTNQLSKSQNVEELLKQTSKAIGTGQLNLPSLVKRFFINEVETDLLAYPEVIEKELLDKLLAEKDTKKEYFDGVNFNNATISSSSLNEFKQMNLFKHNIDKQFGGLGYSTSETFLANEPEAHHLGIALPLNAHRLVCGVISKYGTLNQKQKYLPRLAEGDLFGTVCILETASYTNSQLMRTIAESQDDTDGWVLKGTKSFVINAAQANFYIVFAQTRTVDLLGDTNDSLTAFLVDGSLPGVSIAEKDETIGCKDVYQSSVNFKNVQLSPDSVLGIAGNGNEIIKDILIQSRLQQSLVNLIQLKNLVEYLSDHCEKSESQIKAHNIGNPTPMEARSIRKLIAEAACSVYGIESTLYLTTAIIDLYEDAKVEVESASIVIYSQENFQNVALNLLGFLDNSATFKGHVIEKYIRNAIQLQSFGEPQDALKLFIGIAGIQYTGERFYEEVKKTRNPLFNPKFIMEQMLKHHTVENVKYFLKIKKHLHPAMDLTSDWFEQSIARLKIGTDILLGQYGRDLPQQHIEILRLSDAAILNFITFACITRASRAFCLKLPNGEYERLLAGCISNTNRDEVKRLMLAVELGPHKSFDGFYQKVAKVVIKAKKYFPEHPLKRFF